jgi:hypothetical protein
MVGRTPVSWAKDGSHPTVTSYSCSWRRQIGEGVQSIAWQDGSCTCCCAGGCPSCCCGPFLEARRIGPWGLFGGGSAPFACACLAPHSSIASRAPPPPAPTLSRLRSWRRWGDKRRRDMKRAQARLTCQYCLTRACHWRGVLWRSEQAEGCRHRHHGLRLFICARLRIC